MAIHVSDHQLDQIEHGEEPALIVRSEQTRKGYAVISESVYQQVRPLLQFVAMQRGTDATDMESTGHFLFDNENDACL
jgi:hypothetical protein